MPYFTLETIAQEKVLNILFIFVGLWPSSQQTLNWIVLRCADMQFPCRWILSKTTETTANSPRTLQTFVKEKLYFTPITLFLESIKDVSQIMTFRQD